MRRIYKRLLIAFLILLILLGAIFSGKLFFEANFVILNGEVHSCRETELDLSGGPVPELEELAKMKELKHLDLRGSGISLGQQQWLQKHLPDCEIQCELLFQDVYYTPDTREISLTSLTTGEVVLLDFLPELETVHAEGCRDYEALRSLEQRHPDCQVLYSVELGGETWDRSARELTLKDVSAEQVNDGLPSLPQAEAVTLTGTLPSMKDIRSLETTYPDIAFRWEVELGGLTLEGDTAEIVLSGSEFSDPEEFVEKLPYFPQLETVDLRDTPLDNDGKRSLAEAYPGLNFRWDVEIGTALIPSDAREADISGQTLESAEIIREALPCFTDLEKLIVCDSGLSHEELDQLNRDFPEVRVVWNFRIDHYNVRTDDVYFAPNKYGVVLSDERLEPLRYCTDMVCVDVGHGRIKSCDWAAYMPELRYLIIADTSITDISVLKDLKELKYLEMFQTSVRDYTPLLSCKALEDLNLCYSYGDPEPIMEMTWLKRLWWDGSRASEKTLAEALPDTLVNCHSSSSTGGGWRQGQNYFDMRDLIGMEYMTG